MDELKERKALERGARAQALLDDPLFEEIFGELEREYFEFWRYSTIQNDVAGRERLWQAGQIVGKVRTHLQTMVRDGKLSSAQLNDLRQGGKG